MHAATAGKDVGERLARGTIEAAEDEIAFEHAQVVPKP